MITKLEERFFIEFSIPKLKPCKYDYGCGHNILCSECERELVYPRINPREVLELIRILICWRGSMEIKPSCFNHVDDEDYYVISTGIELYSQDGASIKDAVLQNCIKHCDDINIYSNIRKVFINE